MGCNYLSLPLIPVSSTTLLKYEYVYMGSCCKSVVFTEVTPPQMMLTQAIDTQGDFFNCLCHSIIYAELWKTAPLYSNPVRKKSPVSQSWCFFVMLLIISLRNRFTGKMIRHVTTVQSCHAHKAVLRCNAWPGIWDFVSMHHRTR